MVASSFCPKLMARGKSAEHPSPASANVKMPSAELLERFHREVASGTSPETALREAQIACIRSTEPALRAPANWAAFELIGGVRARA